MEDDEVHGSKADAVAALEDVSVKVLLETVVVVGHVVEVGEEAIGGSVVWVVSAG